MPQNLASEIAAFQKSFLAFEMDAMPAWADSLLAAGASVQDFLAACMPCMEEVGKKFEAGEYFLPQLAVSGEMFKIVGSRMKAALPDSNPGAGLGSMVIGTPRGDIHDLGKDIFATLAEGSGIRVHNLGIDVAPAILVKKVKETGAAVLGLSCLLTTTFDAVRETVGLLEQEGLRSGTLVIIGGGATEKSLAAKLGVDAQTRDAYEGIRMVKNFLAGNAAQKEAVA